MQELKSEHPGVVWRREYGKWCVSYSDRGKKIHVGNYFTEEDAVSAYNDAVYERNMRYVTPVDKIDGEEWADVGWNDAYSVSNMGRVLTKNYNRTGLPSIMKQQMNNRGYMRIILGGRKTPQQVHRLVWEAFNGELKDGEQINHKNLDKTDNRLENLEACTASHNQNHYQESIGKKKVGVWYDDDRKGWVAVVPGEKTPRMYLGVWDTQSEAESHYQEHFS